MPDAPDSKQQTWHESERRRAALTAEEVHNIVQDTIYAERRYQVADGPTWMSGLPTWVRAAAILGPINLIAMGVVYVGVRNVPDIRLELVAIRKTQEMSQATLSGLASSIDRLDNSIKGLCSAIAKDDASRRECWSSLPRSNRGSE